MKARLAKKIRKVQDGINAQLSREYDELNRTGRAMQREGYEGGYLQALADVMANIDGYVDVNSRHADLWRKA